MKPPLSEIMGSTRRVADAKRGRVIRRYHVVRELFTRDRWEERPLERERRVFKFRRDAEAQAGYLHAIRVSDKVRFRVVRRPLK